MNKKTMKSLLDEWEMRPHHNKPFISDGIIDKDRWEKSRHKVLFLLKEAYDSDKETKINWDLCKEIRDEWQGPKYKMWWTAAYWAYGILNANKDTPAFPKDNDKVREAFLSTAIVNIKKSGGNSSSDDIDLGKYVNNDWDLIQEQIELINPTIIICGSTWPLIEHKFKLSDVGEISERLYKANGYLWLEYWHPANQWPNIVNYYTVISLLKIGGVI